MLFLDQQHRLRSKLANPIKDQRCAKVSNIYGYLSAVPFLDVFGIDECESDLEVSEEFEVLM